MKSIYVFICFIILPFIATAQENFKDAVVAATNLNVLYLGISNPVEIAVPGVTSDKVTATVTNGTINKSGTGWEVNPSSSGNVLISVFANGKKVSEKNFRVKQLPLPVAVFAGLSSGSVSKTEVSNTGVLKAELKDFLWDMKFEIQSFKFAFSKDGNDKELTSKTNQLTDEMKSVIAAMTQGQYVTFKDIKAKGPDGRLLTLSPLILKID